MSDLRVASRYSKALIDSAVEQKAVEKVYQDMLLIDEVCSQNRKLVVLLKNPTIKYDYKLRVLQEIFKKHVTPLTLNFINLICRKNRADILPDTGAVFTKLYDELNGIARANVSTASEISSALKKEFSQILVKETGKKVELVTTTDESLIGGFVLRIGDDQIDDSLKSKLNSLRREMKSRP